MFVRVAIALGTGFCTGMLCMLLLWNYRLEPTVFPGIWPWAVAAYNNGLSDCGLPPDVQAHNRDFSASAIEGIARLHLGWMINTQASPRRSDDH